MRRHSLVLAGWLGLVVSTPADANRLGKEACDALKVEQAALVAAGVRDKMQGGPERARSLAAADLQQIKQLIEVEEAIAFRCDRPRIAALKPPLPPPAPTAEGATAATPDGAAPAEEAEAAPPPPPKGKKKKAKAAPAADAKAAETAPQSQPKGEHPAAAPAKKKKPKVDAASAPAAAAPAAAAPEAAAKKTQ